MLQAMAMVAVNGFLEIGNFLHHSNWPAVRQLTWSSSGQGMIKILDRHESLKKNGINN